MIDPMTLEQVHRLIRLVLRDIAERGGAEDDAGAVVTGTADR
jgi:hypothetical protein